MEMLCRAQETDMDHSHMIKAIGGTNWQKIIAGNRQIIISHLCEKNAMPDKHCLQVGYHCWWCQAGTCSGLFEKCSNHEIIILAISVIWLFLQVFMICDTLNFWSVAYPMCPLLFSVSFIHLAGHFVPQCIVHHYQPLSSFKSSPSCAWCIIVYMIPFSKPCQELTVQTGILVAFCSTEAGSAAETMLTWRATSLSVEELEVCVLLQAHQGNAPTMNICVPFSLIIRQCMCGLCACSLGCPQIKAFNAHVS